MVIRPFASTLPFQLVTQPSASLDAQVASRSTRHAGQHSLARVVGIRQLVDVEGLQLEDLERWLEGRIAAAVTGRAASHQLAFRNADPHASFACRTLHLRASIGDVGIVGFEQKPRRRLGRAIGHVGFSLTTAASQQLTKQRAERDTTRVRHGTNSYHVRIVSAAWRWV